MKKLKIILSLMLAISILLVPVITFAANHSRIWINRTEYYYGINDTQVPETLKVTEYRYGFVYTGFINLVSSSSQTSGKITAEYSGYIYLDENVTINSVEDIY